MSTISYYDSNAISYAHSTVNVDLSELYDRFLPLIKKNGHILDAGCGSGRDSKYFIEKGFKVTAIDGSAEMCKIASSYIGQEVKHIRFEDFKEINKYDGIWACSSILHLEKNTLKEVLLNLSKALKDDGYIYASFKVGDEEGFIEDRYFSNFTIESFSCFLNEIKDLAIHDVWITNDKRKIRCEELWLNTILKKV